MHGTSDCGIRPHVEDFVWCKGVRKNDHYALGRGGRRTGGSKFLPARITSAAKRRCSSIIIMRSSLVNWKYQ